MINYDFSFKDTLEREKHIVFTSDMSERTMKALAHHDNVIKALEKQVPKKPIWKRGWHCDEMTTYSEWHCPHCNDFFRVDEMHLFCPSCGQAIDWSEQGGDK